jgi:nucleoid-associated protein YgaU
LLKAAGVGMMVMVSAALMGWGARAQSGGAESPQRPDPAVRQQAEALAEAASKYFGDILNGDRVAQAPSQSPAAAHPPAARDQTPTHPPFGQRSSEDRSASSLLRWVAHSSQVYQALMRQLAKGAAPPAVVPARTPVETPVVTPVETPMAARAPAPAADRPATVAQAEARPDQPAHFAWLTESSERFQALMATLAKRAAPPQRWDPVADAERRTGQHKRADTTIAPERGAQAGLNVDTITSPTNTDAVKRTAPQTVAEERRLALIRRADADTRAEEVKKTQDALQGPDSKTPAAAKKRLQATATAAPAKSAQTKTAAQATPARGAAEQPRVPAEAKGLKQDKGGNAEADAQRRLTQRADRSVAAAAAFGGRQLAQATPPAVAEETPKTPAPNATRATRQAHRRMHTHAPKNPAVAALTQAPRGRHHGGAPAHCAAAGNAVDLPGWYVVKEGDTLWSIAHRHYGAGWQYKRIFAANRKRVRKPHWIYPCQKLYLTRSARRA